MDKKECPKNFGNDPNWIIELVEILSDKNIDNLSDNQKKNFRDQYLENLKDGFKPKDAIQRSIQNVTDFK
jgi:hypothetical protein